MNKKNIQADCESSFKNDIRISDGIQWIPVSDAKAAIGFAITNTIFAITEDRSNEVASTSEIMDMVKETLEQSKAYNLEIEVLAFALIALKKDPTLTISQALESGLQEWDI